MPRILLAILLGNGIAYGAWRAAWLVIPELWPAGAAADSVPWQLAKVALTAILLAAPPVLIGAASAWLARRAHLWVGLASGLWALSLIRFLPAEIPGLARLWFAPSVLILLSSTLGGWMLDLSSQARRLADRSAPDQPA